MLIGGAVPFLFSSFAIKAVSRAAYQIVFEVRRQGVEDSNDPQHPVRMACHGFERRTHRA